MKRSRLALAGLALLVLLSGCVGGGGEVETDALLGEAAYDWDDSSDVSYNVTSDRYAAVHALTNRSHLELYNYDALGTEVPIDITALRFRFPNGTVVTANHTELSAAKGQHRTNVSVPAPDGQVAFSSFRNGKQFSSPVYVDGSHVVTLPESARVGIPLLSRVNPGGYAANLSDDRVTLRWDNLSGGSLTLRWYLELDLLLFGGIAIGGLGLAIGGTAYYVRKIRRLKRRREGVDLDVGEDDDPTDRGPPPGMR